MATTLEDTGLWLPLIMDVKILVIIAEHTTQTSVQQIAGSLLKPGMSYLGMCKYTGN